MRSPISVPLWLAAVALSAILPSVHSHAYLAEPASRNAISFTSQRDWCPHCLNAGGEWAGCTPTWAA